MTFAAVKDCFFLLLIILMMADMRQGHRLAYSPVNDAAELNVFTAQFNVFFFPT